MEYHRSESIEVALAALMDSLAQVLIQLDVTPARLTQISRTSFVKAAALQARKRSSGRPHLARIAAVTGLTRVEVKRIVQEDFSIEKRCLESQPRALRVLAAWKTSPGYTTGGKPRQLAIKGPAPSFAALCRAHSGDIPFQVVMGELERMSRIRVNKQRSKVAIASSPSPDPRNTRARQAFRFGALLLAEALREELVLVRRKQRIYSSTSVPQTYFEQAISERVNELLDQMPALFPTRKRSTRGSVNVYTLVSRSGGSRGKREIA